MRRILVTRHPGAIDWMRQQEQEFELIEHLDASALGLLKPGDEVTGMLPVNLVAEVCRRGAQYRHLVLETPPELRGTSLSAADMSALKARIEPYRAYPVRQFAASGHQPPPTPGSSYHAHPGRAWRQFGQVLLAFLPFTLMAYMIDASYDHFSWLSEYLLASDARVGGHATVFIHLSLGLVCLSFGALAAYVLWSMRQQILAFHVYRMAEVKPKRILVQALSRTDFGVPFPEFARIMEQEGIDVVARNKAEFEGQYDVNDPTQAQIRKVCGNRWQQNFRIIQRHRDQLEVIIVIVSEGEKGSAHQFEQFREVTTRLLTPWERPVEVVQAPGEPIDFENHDQVRRQLREILSLCKRNYNAGNSDIAIDITSGTKIFSVAAATITLNKDMTYTYVNNDGRVSSYDDSVTLGDVI